MSFPSPYISVIVPCRNEVRFLGRCLDSILASDYLAEEMEVLVVDGRSTDGTRDLIEKYAAGDARVKMVDNPNHSTPLALNRGIEAARGAVIARIDAHAAIAPDYLSRAVAHLESSGAANVGGPMRTLSQTTGPLSGAIVAALSHRFGVGNSYFRIGSAEPRWVDTVFGGCWPRSVFETVGLFNPDLKRSQDMEFNLRLKAAGLRTLLAPDIHCDYYARTAAADFLRHNFINGKWAILPFVFSRAIPVSLRHLVPFLFALGVLTGLAAAPWCAVPLGLVAVPYAAANLGASLAVAFSERKPLYFFLMPVVFLALHLSYGLGSVAGAFEAVAIWMARMRWIRGRDKSCLPQP